ncbi:unnamed protein product, partial [Vitis vinifera]|uniref:Uncharacterized protein n=1 Tax=Vitis vinifera TaxID=29760 RepID=D7TQD8_VITVI
MNQDFFGSSWTEPLTSDDHSKKYASGLSSLLTLRDSDVVKEFLHHLQARWEVKRKEFSLVEEFISRGNEFSPMRD